MLTVGVDGGRDGPRCGTVRAGPVATALVTGAGRGVGAGIARVLAAAGATVA
ncbi:hypothetical protein GS575_07790, partial [Rhodococcus hoagii]|nr:hypothetical protein [Prescottella equi]